MYDCSVFCRESFEKFCDKEENWFDIDRKGFQKWIEMDLEVRFI